jgi:hypothetical protein
MGEITLLRMSRAAPEADALPLHAGGLSYHARLRGTAAAAASQGRKKNGHSDVPESRYQRRRVETSRIAPEFSPQTMSKSNASQAGRENRGNIEVSGLPAVEL